MDKVNTDTEQAAVTAETAAVSSFTHSFTSPHPTPISVIHTFCTVSNYYVCAIMHTCPSTYITVHQLSLVSTDHVWCCSHTAEDTEWPWVSQYRRHLCRAPAVSTNIIHNPLITTPLIMPCIKLLCKFTMLFSIFHALTMCINSQCSFQYSMHYKFTMASYVLIHSLYYQLCVSIFCVLFDFCEFVCVYMNSDWRSVLSSWRTI